MSVIVNVHIEGEIGVPNESRSIELIILLVTRNMEYFGIYVMLLSSLWY